MAKSVKFFTEQLRDIPIIGDDLSQIGRAVNILATPCNVTVEIWVTALFHAMPTLVWSLAKPEIVDTDIGHRGRGRRKGRKLRFHYSQIFQFEMHQIKLPRTVAMTINEAAQRVGWYLLVMDATSDFVINWTSMAYQWGGCPGVSPTPNFIADMPIQIAVLGNAPDWKTIGNLGLSYVERVQALTVPTRYRILDDCLPLFHIKGSWTPYAGDPGYIYAFRIIDFNTGKVWMEAGTTGSAGAGCSIDATHVPDEQLDADTVLALQFLGTDGYMNGVEELKWTVNSARPLEPLSLLPDP